MKRIFLLFSLIFYLILSTSAVYAVTPYEYGDSFFSLKMNGNLSDSAYWYFYYGKEGSEISTENVYEGKTALKCDISKINEIDTSYPFILHTNSVENTNGISDNNICFEIYTSSSEVVHESLTFAVYFDMPDGTQKVIKNFAAEDAKDGWMRNYCIVDAETVKGFSKCNIGVLLAKNTNLSGTFYVDNIAMKVCPKDIMINDLFVDGISGCLNDIRVFGLDKNGNKKIVKDNSLIKWSVLEGNAEIIGTELVSRDTKPTNVLLEADFLGQKTNFSVFFKNKSVYMSDNPYIKDNEVHCTLTNNSGVDSEVSLFVMVYDGELLYNVNIISQYLHSGETATISKKINIPSILNKPEIRFFYWNMSGEISEVYDLNIV